jgi:hypothetical protein
VYETHADQAEQPAHVEQFAKIEEFTDEEADALFDKAARLYLQMSGDEFREQWHRGDYDDDPDRSGVMTMAMLLPLVERQEVRGLASYVA